MEKYKNMITAEEFIRERYDWSSEDLERWIDKMSQLPMADYNNVIDLMISFAQYHVVKALEGAIDKADIKVVDRINRVTFGFDRVCEVDTSSIKDAYPLTNII